MVNDLIILLLPCTPTPQSLSLPDNTFLIHFLALPTPVLLKSLYHSTFKQCHWGQTTYSCSNSLHFGLLIRGELSCSSAKNYPSIYSEYRPIYLALSLMATGQSGVYF